MHFFYSTNALLKNQALKYSRPINQSLYWCFVLIININNLGDKCRQFRVKSNKSQENLAFDTNVAVSTITRIENNRVAPKFDKVISIFNELGYEVCLVEKKEKEQ